MCHTQVTIAGQWSSVNGKMGGNNVEHLLPHPHPYNRLFISANGYE